MHAPSSVIFEHYFTQNSQQNSISGLGLAISLGVIRRKPMILNPILLYHSSNIFVDKGCAVVAYDPMGNPEATYNMLPYEVNYGYPGRLFEWDGFYPLCEILRDDQNPYASIGGWIYKSNKIKPPSMEESWYSHVL